MGGLRAFPNAQHLLLYRAVRYGRVNFWLLE